MPYKDGTGPFGKGAMTGRRMGPCAGGTAPMQKSSCRRLAFEGMDKEDQKKILVAERKAIDDELKKLE